MEAAVEDDYTERQTQRMNSDEKEKRSDSIFDQPKHKICRESLHLSKLYS